MNGLANTLVSAATANVATHGVVDVGVGGMRFLREKRDRGHDLAGLAVAALGNVFRNPGLLDGMAAVFGNALDGGDAFSGNVGDGQHAGTRRFAVDVHSASAALHDAAAEFRAGHVEGVAQNPEKRHVWADVDGLGFPIQSERDGHGVLLEQVDIVQQSGND